MDDMPSHDAAATGRFGPGRVLSVSASSEHGFSKVVQPSIRLLAGLGVEGDAHAGITVKHRSRVAVDPTQPNLRQVHLIHAELFTELASKGFQLSPGALGENILTEDIALLDLPAGTRLHLGREAIVEVTGLRNPCTQIDGLMPGLRAELIVKLGKGKLIRKGGIMGIVLAGGTVASGDTITVELPAPPLRPLDRV